MSSHLTAERNFGSLTGMLKPELVEKMAHSTFLSSDETCIIVQMKKELLLFILIKISI